MSCARSKAEMSEAKVVACLRAHGDFAWYRDRLCRKNALVILVTADGAHKDQPG